MKRPGTRIATVAAGATLIASFFVLQYALGAWVNGRPLRFVYWFGTELGYWYLLALALPLVLFFARRFRVERSAWRRTVPIHVLLALGIGLVHSAVYAIGLQVALAASADVDWIAVARRLPTNVLTVFWKYWVAVGVFYAYDYYAKYQERALRAAQLERHLGEARLQALRSQLNPHFLFNTLHAIWLLIEEAPATASRMLVALSDLLRATLEGEGAHEVELAEEIAFIRRYLDIEQARFGDRMSVIWEIPDDLLDILLPPLLLQPLVENAIRHGVFGSPGARTVRIGARGETGHVILSVEDDGPGLPDEWNLERDANVGLGNTRARLATQYGKTARLHVSNRAEGGARAVVRLPVRRPGAHQTRIEGGTWR